MISEKVLNDRQAVSVAEALASANEVASKEGVYSREVRIVIEEKKTPEGVALWRINYLPIPPPGVFMRGGDYIVEVNAHSGEIHRAVHGQ